MSGGAGSSSGSGGPPFLSTARLRAGLALSSLTVAQLWVDYVGLGGSLSEEQLISALQGGELPRHDHDVVAHALNEHFSEHGSDHPVAYTDEISDRTDRWA